MLKIIFPTLGVMLTNIFGFNILKSYILNRDKLIHEYDEILFYTIIFNTTGWILYGAVIKDIFIFTSGITTLISSFGFIQIMYKYINPGKLIYIEIISISSYLYFISIIGLINFSNIDINKIKLTLGISCIFSTIIMNVTPLLIIKQVIITQKTDLIYYPNALINFITYCCWFIYSILHYNVILLITNSVCLTLCLSQLLVYFYIRFKNKDDVINLV